MTTEFTPLPIPTRYGMEDEGEFLLKLAQPATPTNPLRIWWVPQVPGKPFYIPIPPTADQVKVAAMLLHTLARYDLFQFENHIKPDYCNAGGLQEWSANDMVGSDPDTGWTDWFDEDGNDIDYYVDTYHAEQQDQLLDFAKAFFKKVKNETLSDNSTSTGPDHN